MSLVRSQEEYEAGRKKELERIRDHEGFETFGDGMSKRFCDLVEIFSDEEYAPCCGLVRLYARLGLHRYNLLMDKKLELVSVKNYNKTFGSCLAATYYITLETKDPHRRDELLTFQAVVGEHGFNKFRLSCDIARPLGETKKDATIKKLDPTAKEIPYYSINELMPNLPPDNPFENSSRFYVLKESELQHNDWIQLYLDLAVATTFRKSMKKRQAPTDLKIMQVSVETTQDPDMPNRGYNIYDATFYIRYQDPCEARVGKDVDRIAFVRRFLDKNSGDLMLIGHTQSFWPAMDEVTKKISNESSVTIIPRKAKKNRFRPLLAVHRSWCFPTRRLRKISSI